jgi:hypothetical protein
MRSIKLSVAVVAVALLTAWTPNPPAGTLDLFSKSYQMTGACNGGDMVYTWSINGAPGGGGVPPAPSSNGASFIYPWRPNDISIRAAEILLIPPGPSTAGMPRYSFLMIGNNTANGDAMVFLAAGELHARHDYPAGTAFEFPGTSDGDATTYMDLHGSCTPGMVANVMLTFYYTQP